MANISITNLCNKQCVYCFASDIRGEQGTVHMGKGTYIQALDYLENNKFEYIRILGGEPTQHPDFIEYLEKAIDKGFKILLFTNGLFSEKILKYLQTIPEKKLSVLLNTIHPSEHNKGGMEQQKKTMKGLGERIICGINIYSPALQLNYLLDYIERYPVKKEVRIGISHSVLSRDNVYLHPNNYGKVGVKIVQLKNKARQLNIKLSLDCGFVPCMFPEEHYELLSDEMKKAGNCCQPVIDLLANGSFISCYPLYRMLQIKINDGMTKVDLANRFMVELKPYKSTGIYPHCSICPLFMNRCNGGCMSFRIQRYRKKTAHG